MTGTRWATLTAGALLALAAALSIGLFGGGSPTLIAPSSVVLVFPLFDNVPMFVVLAAPSLCFWAWSFQLFGGKAGVPKRTLVLHGAVAVLSVVWFVLGWSYGLQFEGTSFTFATAAISAGFAVTIAFLAWRNPRSTSFERSLSVHWLLFAWVVTYAFPYLGETP